MNVEDSQNFKKSLLIYFVDVFFDKDNKNMESEHSHFKIQSRA